MIKILMVCGSGLGSSFILEMNAKKILQDLGVEAEVNHCDLSSAKGTPADVYVTTADLVDLLQGVRGEVVSLVNLLDQNHLRHKLQEVLHKLGAL